MGRGMATPRKAAEAGKREWGPRTLCVTFHCHLTMFFQTSFPPVEELQGCVRDHRWKRKGSPSRPSPTWKLLAWLPPPRGALAEDSALCMKISHSPALAAGTETSGVPEVEMEKVGERLSEEAIAVLGRQKRESFDKACMGGQIHQGACLGLRQASRKEESGYHLFPETNIPSNVKTKRNLFNTCLYSVE